jgi:hypothetical protein
VILVHFSLQMSNKLDLLAGTYLGMLPDWYKDPDGDPGALLSVDVQKVRALPLVHSAALQASDL